jgi:hypothetical protein
MRKLTGEREEAVRAAVEKALEALIAETDVMMQKPQKTLRGKVRKLAFKVLVDTESLSQATPEYAQAVIDEVKKPANMAKIKELALKQIAAANPDLYVGDDRQSVSILRSVVAPAPKTGNAQKRSMGYRSRWRSSFCCRPWLCR